MTTGLKGEAFCQYNSACWWAVNQAWPFDNTADCTASHVSCLPSPSSTRCDSKLVNPDKSLALQRLHWHNSERIIKIDGHCQKSRIMCSSLCLLPRAWCMTSKNGGKALPIVAPFPGQNKSTRLCSWRAAAVVDTVANTRRNKSLWCQLPGPYLRQYLKKNPMRNVKKWMMDLERDVIKQHQLCFLNVGTNPSTVVVGKDFPGLKCRPIVTLEDTWNYW